jgi:nucleoside-triphosphatase THEP1
VLAVVHAKASDSLINEAKQREDAEIFTVSLANRDMLAEDITKKAKVNLKQA